MDCYCFVEEYFSIYLPMAELSLKKRFDTPWFGPITSFGGDLLYPIWSRDEGRMHQFDSRVLPWILVGFILNASGSWSGNLHIVDAEDLNNYPAPEINVERFEAKKVEARILHGSVHISLRKWLNTAGRISSSIFTQRYLERGM